MTREPSKDALVSAHCWEPGDRVPHDDTTTAFRRSIRYKQARWRAAKGYPIGTQPIAPRPNDVRVRLVGSRLPLDDAKETGANFITTSALDAARHRAMTPEPHQTFDHGRFWADLLWSPSLACNLFGDLAADPAFATRAIRKWWPDAPGTVTDVRFSYSPGRLDPSYLNSLRIFDAAVRLDGGVIGIGVRYHEWAKPETPRPENIERYLEVATRSGIYRPGALDALRQRSGLAVLWLEHLLVHAMLQHPSNAWKWGRYVVVYPAGNASIADACARYTSLLADGSTFATMTLEALLASRALPRATTAVLRERYVPD